MSAFDGLSVMTFKKDIIKSVIEQSKIIGLLL